MKLQVVTAILLISLLCLVESELLPSNPPDSPGELLIDAMKAMIGMPSGDDTKKVVGASAAADSSNHKMFSKMLMTPEQCNKVFNILDRNRDRFLDRIEIKGFLKNFKPGSKGLTEKEIKDFLKAGDTNGDEKIDCAEIAALVRS